MEADIEKSIADVLKQFPEIEFCTLFGSAATGRLTDASDIDIAISGAVPLSISQRRALSLELSEALQREVDLIDLQSVSGLILEQALCQAKIIRNNDSELYANLLKRLWYNQADFMPYVKRIMEERVHKWLH